MAGVVAVCMACESWRTGQMMGWDAKKEQLSPPIPWNLPHLISRKGKAVKQMTSDQGVGRRVVGADDFVIPGGDEPWIPAENGSERLGDSL